jgi:hypothetical protein
MVIFSKIFWIGKEGPFADDIVFRIQALINGLKSKVGHSHMVGIGIDETYRIFPAPWFSDSSPLFFENAFSLLNKFPGNHLLGLALRVLGLAITKLNITEKCLIPNP